MLYQGGNSPIFLDFDENITTTNMSVSLFDNTGKTIKKWIHSDISISGKRATLTLTQQDTAAFPVGTIILEAKWLDADGVVQLSEPVELTVEKRYDKVVIL